MKKTLVLVVLVSLLTAGNVFAHDKGDLMMHIEPQLGLSIPTIVPKGVPDDYDQEAIGFEYSFRVRVAYYFLDFFGVSAGLGMCGLIDIWSFNYYDPYYNKDETDADIFTRAYLTIPFGVNFSLSAFAIGGGLSINLPLGEGSADWSTFYLNNYLGWYLDVGFDTSGNKGQGGGFGMSLRLAGSLGKDLAGYKVAGQKVKLNYQDFTISIVFSPAIQLGNFPIGGSN